MKYAYFPGCSLHSTSKEYDISTRAVAQALGIELYEIPDWICCGASPAHTTLHYLSLALPVKNLLITQSAGANELAVSCAACFNRLKTANHIVKTDEEKRGKINELLKDRYEGEVKIKHFLEIIVKEYGLEKITQKISRKLTGLKVACYYGCLLVRPHKIMEFDDVENPQIMDRLMTALGAQSLDWPYKVECCGASFSLTKTDIVLKLGNDILQTAKDAGADCLVVACPLCQSNLDLRQREIEKKYNTKFNLPILYFTQLLGLALSIDPKKLGLNKHIISPQTLLKEKILL
ncbi:MAG: CoB--CoM heterodisulfide reductase iron-sulfur subunit B family protein [Elusimicrobiota bacterium]